jgi:hypothetical protein
MALKALESQLGVDIGRGVLLITREKKYCQGEVHNCIESSHAQVLLLAENFCIREPVCPNHPEYAIVQRHFSQFTGRGLAVDINTFDVDDAIILCRREKGAVPFTK